jgi:hypothetical protein
MKQNFDESGVRTGEGGGAVASELTSRSQLRKPKFNSIQNLTNSSFSIKHAMTSFENST